MNEALEVFVRTEVEGLGYDLVELRKGGTARRPLLDVRIDRTDGARITIDECARVSRALEPRLDASGLVGENYVLEVSSPGVERPLRNAADWRRFTGRTAKVLAPSLGGRLEVEVVGVDDSSGEPVAIMREARGTEHRVALRDVREARLVFHWNAGKPGDGRQGRQD
ncbi:MAG TPA: ribosome maturation factor RimP [Gemmatimonadaceae bacterium]